MGFPPYSCSHNNRPLQLFCVDGMFGSIYESEGCRQLPGSKLGLPESAACPITFPRADALRNHISVEKLHGPIVMITAVQETDLTGLLFIKCCQR